jgi:exodeoxyribonuclease V gamma subunit
VPGFHIHRSNRLERLVTALGDLLAEPVGTPLDPDLVVVQGRGMGIWLGGELSKRFGVWAAPLVYPRAFVEQVVKAVLGSEALGEPPLSEELLQWAVLAALPQLAQQPEFAAVTRYQEGDSHGTRALELAQRIATVFDHYLTYRPEWLQAWEQGSFADLAESDRWQALLWRHVAAGLQRPHLAGAVERLAARLKSRAKPEGLPPRVLVFGLSTLPPLYVRVLALLSRHCDVHCFLFSAAPGATESSPNPLLSSLGALGNDFEQVLGGELRAVRVTPVLHDCYEAPVGQSLVSHLQRDLHVAAAASPAKLPVGSRSAAKGVAAVPEISVHSCHGAMREVEVLHDQLLALLTDPQQAIAPEEVIVLVPNLHSYAPLIEAVFARDLGDRQFIPYHVADQSERQQETLIEGVLRVLGMVGGRVKGSEVVDLLLLDSVSRRLHLQTSDLERIREWILRSGVRWGIDAKHRVDMGQPQTDAHTWQFGLRRLLLGYALPSNNERSFAGVLGHDEVEGKEALLVGALAGFTRTLFHWLQDLQTPRSLGDWIISLGELSSQLFAEDQESARQMARLSRLLEQQRAMAAVAGFKGDVDVQVVTRLIERELDGAAQDRGFFSGGVTFCALIPMRSIPFKVVALLGMNDGEFPRSPQPLEIDLIAKGERRLGDRSRRDDDRYLFLETVCAVRERLIVTYSGQSTRDNRRRPPSVCVSELLGYLADRCAAPIESFVIEHKLQGFHPEYFQSHAPSQGNPALFSYAESYAKAAERTLLARQQQRVFFAGKLEPPDNKQLDIEELVRFFRSPARFFLNRRLGLYLKYDETPAPDREPLELDILTGWSLGDELVKQLLTGHSFEDCVRLQRAQGTLPFGHAGQLQMERLKTQCEAIAAQVRVQRGGQRVAALALDVALDSGVRIKGTVQDRWTNGIVVGTYSDIKVRHGLPVWLRHVASCAHGQSARGVLVGRSSKKPFQVMAWRPVPEHDARKILSDLVSIYERGHERPLPFLPLTSEEYFQGRPDLVRALELATSFFDSDESESQRDPHAARAFSGLLPPFDLEFDARSKKLEQTEFHELALAVYEPFHAWREAS